MTFTTSGPTPPEFWNALQSELLEALDDEARELEDELVSATPSGVTRALRKGWFVKTGNVEKPVFEVGQTKDYFLPLELGRRPGKGISAEGRDNVMAWARQKLGMSESESKTFAFLLSRKYKREGMPAKGFAGLAVPGSLPQKAPGDVLEPINGGLIWKSFKRLEARLERI